MPLISFPQRLADLAAAGPDRPAITCGPDTITRAGLVAEAGAFAARLAAAGVTEGDMVTIAVPNSVAWFVATAAAWHLGAIPQPVSSRLPGREMAAIIDLAAPAAVVGGGEAAGEGRPVFTIDAVRAPGTEAAPARPDVISPAWKAPTSGGSTGRPKLIVSGDPAAFDTDAAPPLRLQPDGTMVMPGPLYHNGPLVWSCQALLQGNHVVVLPRFDAETTLAAIAEHQADIVYLVPTMMKRIWRLPADVREGYDLSSLRFVWHLAEPCPMWLKEAWIDWLGPERIVELYAGTEAQLATVITGTEWLEHRGSVGRPLGGEVMICDPTGDEVPAGVEGEVWMRSARETPTYRYVGAEARRRDGGWESLGDMGWVDDDGYLYLGDRMQDMILTGGANVYPAEVEAALQEHPRVRSCVVIGLPDDDLGSIVHAIVEADPEADAVSAGDLAAFLGERLVRYKVPRSFEFVTEALRDDAGKVRRAALRAERTAP